MKPARKTLTVQELIEKLSELTSEERKLPIRVNVGLIGCAIDSIRPSTFIHDGTSTSYICIDSEDAFDAVNFFRG